MNLNSTATNKSFYKMQLKLKFLNHYRRARKEGRVHIYKRPYLVPVMGLILGLLIVGFITLSKDNYELRPGDSRVVYLFDSGTKQTLNTKAATVGDLIKKLPLNLIAEDVIEPSLDTPIVEDNFRINVYRARPVTVVDNGTKMVTITAQKSPRVAAQDAGLTVYPEDRATFAQGQIAENTIGEKILIDRATPISFILYGTPLTVRTHSKTVGELLKEKNVVLQKDDTLTPGAETLITENIQVKLVRNGTQVLTVEEAITPPVQYVEDANLSFGATAPRQPGAAGKRAVTYQVVTENGIEKSRTVLQQTIIQEPVPQIVARGKAVDVNGDRSAWMAAAGISAGDYGYVNYIVSRESGWCYTKWQGEYGACTPYHGTPTSAGVGYGLCQSTPGYKMASAGADWGSNPITQLRWCNNYAQARHKGWAGAYNYWLANRNW